MQKTIMLVFSLVIPFVFGMIELSSAAVPPPPANQYLGIYDTDFGYLTRVKCLECHFSDQILVQRHHALLNSAPPAKTYECLSCHVLIPDGSGGYVFEDFRTCENCHTTSPHHTTPAVIARQCNVCHGSFVDNYDDGHYIPTYPKSSVTPDTYGQTYTDPTTGAISVTGGCGACHQPDATAIDPNTGTVRPVLSNKQTHHSTHLSCSLCHDIHGALKDIRKCETCHGIKSLHNIQKDSPAASNPGTIVPGEEDSGWGHVGNNSDCNGCHLSVFRGASMAPSTATVPAIGSLSSQTVRSNQSSILTISGSGFVNSSMGTTYSPVIVIGNESTSISITPTSYSEAEIVLVIPSLVAGNYDLRVVKNDKQSNRSRITVVPFLSAKSAIIGNNSTITIVGSGFRTPPPTDYSSGLGVFINNVEARVLSWSETKIVVSVKGAKPGNTVVVKSLNGTASVSATAAVKKTR